MALVDRRARRRRGVDARARLARSRRRQPAARRGGGLRRSRGDDDHEHGPDGGQRRPRRVPRHGESSGFRPAPINGTIYAGVPPADAAAADAETAYNDAAGQPCDFTLSDPDLGGETLPPGVYCFTVSEVHLTGTLTLDAGGDANAAWIFKTGSSLVTASNSAVVLIGGATPCNNDNITWQVGSSATLGSSTSFLGNILASASVTLNTGAVTTGGLYGNTGAVTMDTNTVSRCASTGGMAGPSIATTPSGSVPVGGSISDSATVIGGASPTGSVVFELFGPGDETCTTPIATRTGTLVGGSAVSGDVTATDAGTLQLGGHVQRRREQQRRDLALRQRARCWSRRRS